MAFHAAPFSRVRQNWPRDGEPGHPAQPKEASGGPEHGGIGGAGIGSPWVGMTWQQGSEKMKSVPKTLQSVGTISRVTPEKTLQSR